MKKLLILLIILSFPSLSYAKDWSKDEDTVLCITGIIEEGTGTDVTDHSDSENDGTLNNGASWSSSVPTGVEGYSMAYDGSDDITEITGSNVEGHDLDFIDGDAWSTSFWVYHTSDGTLFSKRDGTTRQFQVYTGSANINIYLSDTLNGNVASLSSNAWTHIIIAIDSSSNITVFKNKVVVFEGSNAGSYSHKDIRFSIGARWEGYPTTGYEMNGKIAEFLVVKRELVLADAEDLYDNGIGYSEEVEAEEDGTYINGKASINGDFYIDY